MTGTSLIQHGVWVGDLDGIGQVRRNNGRRFFGAGKIGDPQGLDLTGTTKGVLRTLNHFRNPLPRQMSLISPQWSKYSGFVLLYKCVKL